MLEDCLFEIQFKNMMVPRQSTLGLVGFKATIELGDRVSCGALLLVREQVGGGPLRL